MVEFSFLLFMSGPTSLFGQACCSGGVPLSNHIGIRPVDNKQLMIKGSTDINMLNSFYNGTKRLDDNNVKRVTQTVFIQGIMGLSERFSMNTLFSWVHHRRTVDGVNALSNVSKTNGIGDAMILGQYQVISRPEYTFYLTAGPKIPIGNHENRDENGILLASDLQPGTGSWDLLSGAGYLKHGLFRPTMDFTITLISKINRYSDRYDGAQRYKYGNDYQFLIGLTDQFLIHKTVVNPGLLFRLWQTSPDRVDGNIFPNTGGAWIYLVPSVNATLHQNISIFSSLEIPVYQNLKGTQLSTTLRVSFGLQFILSLKKNSNIIPELKLFQ